MPSTTRPLDTSISPGDGGHRTDHIAHAEWINIAITTEELSSATPQGDIVGGSAGVATTVSRADHKHPSGASTASATTDRVLTAALTSDPAKRYEIWADGTVTMGDAPKTVSNVTGTSTVTVTTSTNHGYGTGDAVTISGVVGFTGANGSFTITRTSATQFTLDGATGSGTYTSGGTVQRQVGVAGSALGGTWNLLLTDTSRTGLTVRGRESNGQALIEARDYLGNHILYVGSTGGFGLISAAATDLVYATDDPFNRKFAANPRGGVRLAGGDPAGGVEVLAIGNTTTGPSANPDGTNLGESAFSTVAGVVVWARDGRARVRTSAGHEDELPSGIHRMSRSVAAPGGGTTLDLSGVVAPTVATSSITATADDQASGPQVAYATTASSGVDAGVISTFGLIQRRWAPYHYARIMTDASAITSTRLAVGMVSAEIAADAGPASTGAYVVAAGAWFRYDTGVDGTAFWRTVTSDATTATVTTTSVAIAANTSYELTIEINSAGTSIRYWINGTLAATHTTNLPGASTALGYTARLRTLAASARSLRLGRIGWSQK